MKKVLILSNHFATIYKFRRELVESLVTRGYEVVVSLPKSYDNEEIKSLYEEIKTMNLEIESLNTKKEKLSL